MVETQFRFRADEPVADPAVTVDSFGEQTNAAAVRIEPGDDARLLLPFLDRLKLVDVNFPSFGDGRGYSSARILREAGYAGELRAVGDLPVTLAWNATPNEPSPVSSTTSWGWKVLAATAGAVAQAPVAPSLVTAGTDSRFLAPVAKDVYRFQPVEFAMKDIEMIHGTNEHMTLTNLEKMVQFYARLIVTAAG